MWLLYFAISLLVAYFTGKPIVEQPASQVVQTQQIIVQSADLQSVTGLQQSADLQSAGLQQDLVWISPPVREELVELPKPVVVLSDDDIKRLYDEGVAEMLRQRALPDDAPLSPRLPLELSLYKGHPDMGYEELHEELMAPRTIRYGLDLGIRVVQRIQDEQEA